MQKALYVLTSLSLLLVVACGVAYTLIPDTTQQQKDTLGVEAPYYGTVRGQVPFTDSEYYSGTTTPATKAWKGIVTDSLLFTSLLSKGCIGTDGSGNVIEGTCTGGSGGGAGNSKWATSTDTRYIQPNNSAGGFQATLGTTTNATTTNQYILSKLTVGTPTSTDSVAINDGNRLSFYSNDLWTYAGGHEGDRIRFFNYTDTAKSAITWYDATSTVPVAVGAIVGHDLLGVGNEHKHISIEVVDDAYQDLNSVFECKYGQVAGSDEAFCGTASQHSFRVGSGGDMKLVDGDFQHGATLDIFPNFDLGNSAIYLRIATTSTGGLYLGGGGTSEFEIDDPLTVTGNITSEGTTILLDSAGTATIANDRAAVTNFGSNIWRTAGTDQWTLGLRNDSTNNMYFRDNINGVNVLTLYQGATPGLNITASTSISGNLKITGNATATNATTTTLFSTTASTSNLYLAIGACDSLDTDSSGKVICGTDAQGGAAAYDAWTHPSAGVSATTSRMIFDSASSTFTRDLNITGNSTTTHATTTTIAATTHATTSSLTVSGNTTLSQLTSALILTGADGLAAEYAGTSCTNQFVRSLSALGAATCATVGTADVSGLDISDDTNLAATWPVVLTGDTLSLGFSTSTALAANNILYATAVNTFGSEAAFTYDPTLNRLTATQASFTLSTTTSATSTNLYAGTASSTNLWAINSVFASTTIGKSTTTQATSTNLFATTASSTNLFGSDFNFGNIFTKVVNAFTAVGTWDFGGADGVEIPNGSSPTVDAIGELALDTTKNMLLIATSTNSSYPATFPNEKVLWSRTLATTSFEYINNKVYLPPKQFAVTATRILCYIAGSNTASVPINLSNSAGSADTNTATCTKTAPSALGTTTTTNVNFAAGTANIIELGTKTTMTNNDAIVFTVYGTIDRD